MVHVVQRIMGQTPFKLKYAKTLLHAYPHYYTLHFRQRVTIPLQYCKDNQDNYNSKYQQKQY